MKRILAIALAITMLILAVGCSANSPPTNDGSTAAYGTTDSSAESRINETDETSTATPTDGTNSEAETSTSTDGTSADGSESTPGTSSSPETSGSDSTEVPPDTSEPEKTQKPPETSEPTGTSTPPTEETSKPTTGGETSTPSTSEPEETEPPETSKPEETKPPETSKPEEAEPPKSAYEYPFDIEQIRQDCIAIAESYGMKLDESLNKNNSSWANPDPASPNTQGDRLKRLLSETIEYYTDDYREAMGLTLLHISSFNIYCEPTGDGSYLIYFLH